MGKHRQAFIRARLKIEKIRAEVRLEAEEKKKKT